MDKEKEFVDGLEKYLSKWFLVKREIWSKCRKSRIDMVITLIGNENIIFGLECKQVNKKRGEEIGEYVRQASRYTKQEFEVQSNIFKRIPILICPPLSCNYFVFNEESKQIDNKTWYRDRHEHYHEHNSVNGFLGVFNVGEFRKYDFENEIFYYISFSNKNIWSSQKVKIWDEIQRKYIGTKTKGLHEKNYSFLVSKINDNNL